jgi:hypothetical protein
MTYFEFAKRISIECEGLPAIIATIAIEEDKLGELMEIYCEHFNQNPKILNKMLGDDLYKIFMKIK